MKYVRIAALCLVFGTMHTVQLPAAKPKGPGLFTKIFDAGVDAAKAVGTAAKDATSAAARAIEVRYEVSSKNAQAKAELNRKIATRINALAAIHKGDWAGKVLYEDFETYEYEVGYNGRCEGNQKTVRRRWTVGELQDKLEQAKKAAEKADAEAAKLEEKKEAALQKLQDQAEKTADSMRKILENKAAAREERETKKAEAEINARANLEARKAEAEEERAGALERLQFLLDKQNIMRLSVATGGLVACYFACKYAYHYAETMLGVPSLVRETSRKTVTEQMSAWVMGEEEKPKSFDDVILPDDIKQSIMMIAHQAQTAHDNGLSYRNVILYGPPGTGKTMFARRLAQVSGMEYALMTGADFSQFFGRNEEVHQLHKLLDWAESSERGLLLFIDEADAFCRDRSKADPRSASLLNAFLARTGSRSKKLMFIFATNHPEIMDKAILSRVDSKVYFPLPTLVEREKLFSLYANKYLFNHKALLERPQEDGTVQRIEVAMQIEPEVNAEFMSEMAKLAEGLAGREVEQIMGTVQNEAYLHPEDLKVTADMIRRAVSTKLYEQAHAGTWTLASTVKEPQHMAAPAA